MSNETTPRLTKNERREQAREQAKAARVAQQKKEKRGRLLLQGGIVLGVIAILAIVGLVIAQAVKPAGPGPQNMASGGVVFEGESFSVQTTPAIEGDADLVAQPVDRETVPLDIVLYADYNCIHCGSFEQQAGPMLEQWVGSGQATLQIYPVNILDNSSGGTKYSTRSANALMCVVDQQPDVAWDLHRLLLSPEVQPVQRSVTSLTNDELIEVVSNAGANVDSELTSCINGVRYADFVNKTTTQALRGPLVGLAEGAQLSDGNGQQPADQPQHITGTPTVIVNGQQAPVAPAELEDFMLKLFAELSPDASSSNGSGSNGNSSSSGQ